MRQGARTSKRGGGGNTMVYLNRFLCVDAGMLAEPIRLQCVECHMTSTLYRRDLCNHSNICVTAIVLYVSSFSSGEVE